MKRKQAAALGLAAVMAVSMCACGNSEKKESKSEGSGASDEKTITYWNIGTEDPDQSILKSAVDYFNENSDSGYQVEMTSIQNDKYKEKLVIAMSSGPDMYTSWTGGPLQEYIESGYAQPVTDLYKEKGLDKIYMESATAQASFNDEIYAVPILNVAISGIFYNKDMFDKYGLKEPETISDLENIC